MSLNLTTHRQYFKTYHNSFTTDEAAENLSALKFSQSNRVPDPKEPSRVVTTTTTTTFSMSREMAKGICQHFMDAHLIENAADPGSIAFKEKGVYVLTPKGLHILERFITKNGINGEHLLKVFSSQPICMKLLHLERRSTDDELLINGAVLEVIFRRFVGRQPNYDPAVTGHRTGDQLESFDRAMGVEVQDVQEKVKGLGLKSFRHSFSATSALDWLCDFTTVSGRDEAAEVMAQFVRLELVALALDKSRRDREPWDDRDVIVRVEDARGNCTEGHFRSHPKTLYHITEKGRVVARWEQPAAGSGVAASLRPTVSSSKASVDSRSNAEEEFSTPSMDRADGSDTGGTDQPAGLNSPDGRVHRKASHVGNQGSVKGSLAVGQGVYDTSAYNAKDSNTKRLRNILEEPALRSLFRDFLRQNFCEENLSFWLDVQDFKRRFHTTSSAVAVRAANGLTDATGTPVKAGMGRKLGRSITEAFNAVGGGESASKDEPIIQGFAAMEKHQQELVSMAFVIYSTYLAPSSPSELNIEHNLRTELVNYMGRILSEAKAAGLPLGSLSPTSSSANLSSPSSEGGSGFSNGAPVDATAKKPVPAAHRFRIPIHASQLQTLVRLYERIQNHIFRLMSTDSVPRFIKDARFLQLVKSVEEYTEALEAGRIDPHDDIGPAIGKDVVEAMDLRSIEPAGASN